jgi:hypothetical protein
VKEYDEAFHHEEAYCQTRAGSDVSEVQIRAYDGCRDMQSLVINTD